MDIDNIVIDLNKRFAAPLKEFYKRRIIFWRDEDKEFIDKLDDFVLENAKVLILTETNNFYAKKLLTLDDTESNYLVYDPFDRSNHEDNWLLDIELYSESFMADLYSIWMHEMNLPANTSVRKEVKACRKYFNAAKRRAKFALLENPPQSGAELHQAIMSIICGSKERRASAIIPSVLATGLDMSSNRVYQELVQYGEDDMFWGMVMKMTGYASSNPTLEQLAAHIICTAATRTMEQEYLKGLEAYISTPYQAFCYDIVSAWLHSENKDTLKEIARHVEQGALLVSRLENVSVIELLNTEVFPCINELILDSIMKNVANDIINVKEIREIIEKRRICSWYDDTKFYFEALLQLANMQEFYLENEKVSDNKNLSFHAVKPQELWNDYVNKYYLMDTYYRKFHVAYANSLDIYNSNINDELWNAVKDKVERLYVNWFLEKLGDNWTKVSASDYAEYGKIQDIPSQSDFYRQRIKPADNRICVIISDALRYEVAASLTQELQHENNSSAKITAMQAVFPSYTKYGMAALLPHTELNIRVKANEDIEVLADGESTSSANRDKILKKENPNSIAIQADKLVKMPRTERKELIKGMQVVYVYHNRIDAEGHSEDDVCGACDEAIAEIKNLIKIMVNDFSAANILVTADHGFMYVYSSLQESDKIGMNEYSEHVSESARRYVIAKKDVEPPYLMPIKFLEGKTEYVAYSPKENIRLKVKGAGLNFVHGGASLQEMVVPVVEYRYLRNSNKEYQRNKEQFDARPVEIALLSNSRKISNMIFNLDFYQKDAVSNNRKASKYEVFITDCTGMVVSDIQKIIADKTEVDEKKRQFHCTLNLKFLKYSNKESYYLIIKNEAGIEVSKTEYKIDIAFTSEDFGLFN